MVSNYDVIIILLLSLFQSYYNNRSDLWIPLLILEKLKWPSVTVNLVFVGFGIASLVPLSIVLVAEVTNELMYYVALTSQVAMVLIDVINLVLFEYNKDQILDVCLWVVFCVLSSILILTQEIFLVSVMAQMVGSRYQVLADGIRLTFFRIGSGIALSTSVLIFEYLKDAVPINIGLVLISLILLIVRRKILMDSHIII